MEKECNAKLSPKKEKCRSNVRGVFTDLLEDIDENMPS
jgi:hypothetical protein